MFYYSPTVGSDGSSVYIANELIKGPLLLTDAHTSELDHSFAHNPFNADFEDIERQIYEGSEGFGSQEFQDIGVEATFEGEEFLASGDNTLLYSFTIHGHIS